MAYRGSNPILAWVLIAINLVLFFATLANEDLIRTLGLQPAVFLDFDRLWTLVTNLFIHANLWHILANMITLYFFGSFLLRLIGVKRFLVVYFGGGILGNLLFILIESSSYSIVIGASGAIFALAGALTVLRPQLRVFIFPIPAPLPIWVAVIGIFVILSFLPNIAWQAHLGGLVLGLVAGFVFRRRGRYYF